MKRVKHLATLVIGEDRTRTREAFSWNGAIKASEDLVRELARSEHDIYEGETPTVLRKGTPERFYTRTWTAHRAGWVVVATVKAITTDKESEL